jgi:hypothetical protein
MGVDKSIPPLRQWELNENSTRYEKNLAAPSDEQLTHYWWAWGSVALAAGIFTLVIFLSVITAAPRIRKQSFNVYLIFLMIPDFSFSLLCGITCLLNAINGSYWSHWMCNFQQWYCVWGIGSNCWLNAIITYELHKLLKNSHQRRRYTIPSRRTVTLQALAVYLYCAFLGTWGLLEREHLPLHAIQISGLACIPVETDMQSSLFFWLFFMPLFSLIPICYVVYVTWDIWWHQLLPPSGKRRLLALYFGRIILVFLVLWGPYFLLNYILATWLPTWVIFAGGTLSHLQGPASAGVSLMKPDIWHAVRRFLHCQCCVPEKDNDDARGQEPTEEFRNIGSGNSEEDESRSFFRRMSTLFRKSRTIGGSLRVDSMAGSANNRLDGYSSMWPDDDGEYTAADDSTPDEEDAGEQGMATGTGIGGPPDESKETQLDPETQVVSEPSDEDNGETIDP